MLQHYPSLSFSPRRVFTALLRLQLDPNPLLFFLDDLLKRPLPPTELNVVGSIVGVWPAPLGRKKDVRLLKGQRLCQEGLEDQMLSYTLEVAVMCKYSSEGKAAGIQESVCLFVCMLYVCL